MNIAGIFLNNEIRTGGHTRYLELMDGLAARGNRVAVLLNSDLAYAPTGALPIRAPVRYRRRSFPPASWLFRAAARRWAPEMRRCLESPDAVVVYGETHLGAGARLARELRVPLIYGQRSNSVREALTYLSEPGNPLPKRFGFLRDLLKAFLEERRIAAAADLIVFQSPYDQDDFLARRPRVNGKVTVIRGDISGPRFLAEYSAVSRSVNLRRVAFVGNLGIRKGVDYLVEAIILLAGREIPGLSFEICGPGERLPELRQRLARAGINDRVHFAGRIPSSFPVLAASDLLVVPSLFDSYPNTILEALHVGTPVIGSRVGGIPDMLRHEVLLFPPMDARAIADRIEKAVREPAFYGRLRELCAKRRAAFQFDWSEAWEAAIRRRLAAMGRAPA